MTLTEEERSEINRQNVKKRWAKTSKEDKTKYGQRAGRVSADKRKKFGWAYWKKKDDSIEE